MAKKKIIVAALALCLVLAGTGYAYWTDSLNITTKATTGELEVKFLDLGLLAQYTNEAPGYVGEEGWSIIDGIGDTGYVDNAFFREADNYRDSNHNTITDVASLEEYAARTKNYNKVTFNAMYDGNEVLEANIGDYKTGDLVGDKINVSVNNIYPAFAQAFRTDIANTGNIAAKLSEIKVDVTAKSSDSIENNIGIAIYMERETSSDNGYVFKLAQQFDSSKTFKLGGVDFVRLSAFDDPSTLDDILKDTLMTLPSDNRMDLYLGVAMDPTAENDTMNGSVDFTIDLDWEQFNAEKVIDATNILNKQNNQGAQ